MGGVWSADGFEIGDQIVNVVAIVIPNPDELRDYASAMGLDTSLDGMGGVLYEYLKGKGDAVEAELIYRIDKAITQEQNDLEAARNFFYDRNPDLLGKKA